MPNERDEFLVYGTYEQIKAELVRLKNQQIMLKGLKVEGGGGTESRVLPLGYAGKIIVKITFEGTTTKGRRHLVEKSFRLMNDDPKTISLDRIKAIGTSVASKFNTFTFTTGQITYTYNDPDSGFSNVWGYFKSLADAQKLFEQMLDVAGKSPDWKLLSTSSYPLAGDRYQDPGNKTQQIGTQVREDVQRPEALMKMKKSMIKFPKIKQWQDLTNSNALVMLNLDWLKKYQD
jgi:hypothetical protein